MYFKLFIMEQQIISPINIPVNFSKIFPNFKAVVLNPHQICLQETLAMSKDATDHPTVGEGCAMGVW